VSALEEYLLIRVQLTVLWKSAQKSYTSAQQSYLGTTVLPRYNNPTSAQRLPRHNNPISTQQCYLNTTVPSKHGSISAQRSYLGTTVSYRYNGPISAQRPYLGIMVLSRYNGPFSMYNVYSSSQRLYIGTTPIWAQRPYLGTTALSGHSIPIWAQRSYLARHNGSTVFRHHNPISAQWSYFVITALSSPGSFCQMNVYWPLGCWVKQVTCIVITASLFTTYCTIKFDQIQHILAI
jgi:hypothetical protein